MPSPFLHLGLACEIAGACGIAGPDRPAFLFGSVAPDIDKFLGLAREATHFWDTRSDVSGTFKLLAAYPHLAAPGLTLPGRAFVAGYLCHLVADEQWTFTIYRPYFGRFSPYRASRDGAYLQWALHSVLEDQLERSGRGADRLIAELAGAQGLPPWGRLLPFLGGDDWRRYHQTLLELARLAPGEARHRYLVARTPAPRAAQAAPPGAPHAPDGEADGLARFLQRLPALKEQVRRYVAPAAIREFERRAAEESVALVRAYLGGRPFRPPLGTADPGDG
jgi:hypothetical protein